MSKILIHGFPHSGTTILRAIIGHIEDVEEIIKEQKQIKRTSKHKYILCKWPWTCEEFYKNKYNEYIKIFIMRNPLFVFSSMNKRANKYNMFHKDSNIEAYIQTIQKFIHIKNNPPKNTYTIIYENLFKNDFQELKAIFDRIGFKYTDKIFKNEEYQNQSHVDIGLSIYKPTDKQHKLYRNWQINQPFVLNNDISKISLTDDQIQQLTNHPDILKIYPNIKSYII